MVNSPILRILFEPYIVEDDKRVFEFLESSINDGDLYYKTYKSKTDKYISKIDEDIKFALSLLFEVAHRDERFDLEKLKKYENSEEGHKNTN